MFTNHYFPPLSSSPLPVPSASLPLCSINVVDTMNIDISLSPSDQLPPSLSPRLLMTLISSFPPCSTTRHCFPSDQSQSSVASSACPPFTHSAPAAPPCTAVQRHRSAPYSSFPLPLCPLSIKSRPFFIYD